ncbi:AB hydrolase superfamily protein [Fusarium oxysporum f. sp. albedinis]|nr:AB hydrolase superfamily protein [Fusarium oxysporum f. sp. albedinis]
MRRPPKRVGGFSVSNARLGSNTNTFFLHLCSDTRLARREAEMKQFDIVFPALAQVSSISFLFRISRVPGVYTVSY